MWTTHGAVDLFGLLCLVLFSALPTVRTQAYCNGESIIHEGVVLYKCEWWTNYYYYICEDSGWGEEEATVVCREHGYSHGNGDSIEWPGHYDGLVHVKCNGNELKLQECVADRSRKQCSRVGVTECYHLPEIISLSSLMVSEGDFAHICVSLKGSLGEIVHVFIETSDENAIANYDYIPVNYNLTFGPSLQSEQCHDIQIINDSLSEGMEMFTVQLTTNSSAIELTTPEIMITIQHNAQAGDCEDGSLTVVSGVNESSLQLVEMCNEGVWSSVCDHNWTVADATVVCRELGMPQDEMVFEVLPSQSSHEAHSVDCEGSEATLADCFVEQETATTCHYVLVHCGAAANSKADRSSAGAIVGGVMAVLVVMVLVVVVVVVVVLVVIWWKANTKSCGKSATTVEPSHYEFAEDYTRPTGGQQPSSLQPAAERREGSVEDFELVNPVYGMGVDQPVPPATMGTPEHNLINPLYAQHSSQGRAEPTGQEYATLEMSHNLTGESNGVNEYNPYENEEGPSTHLNGEAATGNKQ